MLSFWARGLQLTYDTGLYMLPTPTTAKLARRKPPKYGLCFSKDTFVGKWKCTPFQTTISLSNAQLHTVKVLGSIPVFWKHEYMHLLL